MQNVREPDTVAALKARRLKIIQIASNETKRLGLEAKKVMQDRDERVRKLDHALGRMKMAEADAKEVLEDV